jgi:hypothetical protein
MGRHSTAALQEVDPVIDQTRAFALQLFRSNISDGRGVPATPDAARAHWKRQAERSGDAALVGILERMDADTFAWTWRLLCKALQVKGLNGMIEWLNHRNADG